MSEKEEVKDELEKTTRNYLEKTISETKIANIQDFDDLLEIVGSYGKYQKILLYGIIGPFSVLLPIFYLNSVFLLSEPAHWCHVNGNENLTMGSIEEWKNLTLPKEIGPDGTERFSQCLMYTSLANHSEIMCQNGWDYDRTDYIGTIPTDFNWVCDKSSYVAKAFTASAVGSSVGTIIFGWAGDKFGRKPFFFLCCFMMVFFRFVSLYLTENFILFLVTQFLTGSIYPMIYIFIFSIAVEIIDKESRSWIYGFGWIIWVAGICFLPLMAWLANHWYLLGLLTSIPGFLQLLYYNYIPESPRWLLTQNRLADTEEILNHVAKVNGTDHKFQPGDLQCALKNIKINQDKIKKDGKSSVNVWSLFSRKRLGINTILLSIAWSMNGIIYYGITLITTSLAGNQFLNFFILSIIELPVGWLGGTLAEKTGRRWTQTFFFFLCAVGFALSILGTVYHHLELIIIVSLVISKFSVATTSLMVTIQAAEIFPTELRATGNGFACSVSSIAAICTPYIIYLGKFHTSIPYVTFCILSFIGMIVSSFLPETLKQSLPETLDDANNLGRNATYWSFLPKDYKRKRSLPSVAIATNHFTTSDVL